MKLTRSANSVFVRIRAPNKLLELQADQDNYKLQLRGEIDPGSFEFWNQELLIKTTAEEDKQPKVPIEIEESRIEYKKNQANEILELLYKAGKIGPNEITVFDNEKTSTWSRRVHTLERVADRVPIYNRYPAYAAFQAKPELRYLYEVYHSVRGKTLFRTKDRLFLTKSVMDRYFDMSVFIEYDLIKAFTALHDANRGDRLTNDILTRRWITFWSVSALEAGGCI